MLWLWWRVPGLPGEQAGSAMGQWAGGYPAAIFCAFSPVPLHLGCYLRTSAYVPLPFEALLFVLWTQSQLYIQTQVYGEEGPAAGQAGGSFGCCSLQWAGLAAGWGTAHGGRGPRSLWNPSGRAGGALCCSDFLPMGLLGTRCHKGKWFLREMKLTQKWTKIRRNRVYTWNKIYLIYII